MKLRFLLLLCLPLAIALMSGCSRNDSAQSLGRGVMATTFAPSGVANDSTPHGPPPHPGPPPNPGPPPAVPAVQFVGSDTVFAGQTSMTHWIVANDSHSTFTMHWTLTDEAGWSSLPQQGTITLPALGTQPLDVAVAVPDTVVAYGDVTATGVIRVSQSSPDSLRSVARTRASRLR